MRIWWWIPMLCGWQVGHAQYFGGNAPSTQWQQINTDTVRVIFPKGLETQAREVVNTVHYLSSHNRTSIGDKMLKIDIVLQNQSVESNGFVALSPLRSVFQLTPPADNFSLGSVDWVHTLSIHEYRHALQHMNFRSGIGKTFYRLFGENGQALVTSLLIPDWFWEGDAVFMETALTPQGRGRLPSFLEPFKGLDYAGRHYRYAKIRNGSYRDMVPGYYPLGYMMAAYGRDTLGVHFWENVTQQALLNDQQIDSVNEKNSQRPYHLFRYGFYPMSATLNYLTGTKIKGFYARALADFSNHWEKELADRVYTPVTIVKANTMRTVLHYRYPKPMDDGSVLAMKYGYAQNPEIVRISPSGQEHRVVSIGPDPEHYFSYGGGRLVWAEQRPDARWGWRGYSVIRSYDLQRRHTTTLSHKSRYFSPSLSADGKQVVVVDVSDQARYHLVILDAQSGHVLDSLPNPEGLSYTYPVFSRDGRAILTAVRLPSGKMAIYRQSLEGGHPIQLTQLFGGPLGPPLEDSAFVFFPAAFSDNIQLYGWRKEDGHLFQIAVRPLGNYSLSLDTARNVFLLDEFSITGYRLEKLPYDPAQWKPVVADTLHSVENNGIVSAFKAEGGNILSRIPNHPYPAHRYHRGIHLFHVHSWSLLPNYPDVGLYLQSQDILNTLQVSAGGGYNFNEHTPYAGFNAAYGGWFPILQAGYRQSFNRSDYMTNNELVHWSESDGYVGLYVQLDFSRNLYERTLTTGITLHRNALDFRTTASGKLPTRRVTYLEASLALANGRSRPIQALYPRFAQTLKLDLLHTLGKVRAHQYTAEVELFFPSLFRNHSIYFTGAFSEKDGRKQYKFTDNFSYASGYGTVPYRRIYTASANYQFPLAYPDWGLTWAYLLRLRMQVFFNYSHAWLQSGITPPQATFRSLGAAIYLDSRLFSSLPMPIGIRYSYLLDPDFTHPDRKSLLQLVVPLTLF